MQQVTELANARDNQQLQNIQQSYNLGYKLQEEKMLRLYNYLEQVTEKKNIMTESEFSKYAILYQQHDIDMSDPNNVEHTVQLQELSREFFDRINPYKEITIVSDTDHSKVVAVLPKIYMQVQTLKEGFDQALSEFDNLTNVPFRRDLHEKGRIALMGAIAASQDVLKDPSIREREMRKFIELDNSLKANVQSNTSTSKNTATKNNTEFESTVAGWEFDE